MRSFLITLILCLVALACAAQELRPVSFEASGDVMHGKMLRQDFNGNTAAIVKVKLPVQGVTFDGNLIGEPEFHTNEYWVWLEAGDDGTRMFDVACPGTETVRVVFADISPVEQLQSKTIYELRFDIPARLLSSGTSGPADPGGNYFSLVVEPRTNVMVLVDGEMQEVTDGQAALFCRYGNHTFEVRAPGHATYSDTFTIVRGGEPVSRTVSLKSSKAMLTLKCATPGAAISLNGQPRGKGSWSGQLSPGSYRLDVELDGYRPYSASIDLAESETKALDIPALAPHYAVLDINCRPVGAKIKIDGKDMGSSPRRFTDLLAGVHSVEISADGYESAVRSVTLDETNPASLSLTLEEQKTSPAELLNQADKLYAEGNKAEAAAIWKSLSDRGDAKAMTIYASALIYGEYIPQDVAKGLELLQRAMEAGSADAEYTYADLLLHGKYVAKDFDKSRAILERLAKAGHINALTSLAMNYEYGWNGFPKDEKLQHKWYGEAEKVFKKGAEAGDPEMMERYASSLYYGNAGHTDYKKAFEMYSKSIEKPHKLRARSAWSLGNMYKNGKSVSKDLKQVEKYYLMAWQDKNDPLYAEYLGKLYLEEPEIRDTSKGLAWYRKAAEKDDYGTTCWVLGDILYNGSYDVPIDKAEARKWWQKGADMGHSNCKDNLAKYK